MRRALLKTAFAAAIVALMIVFLIPASILLDAMFPMRPGPSGHHQGDRLLPGILTVALSLYMADRIISFLFRISRLSDGRWSVFDRRPRRGSRSDAPPHGRPDRYGPG
jgi:hypothetical protein